jgi:hypothetical protein
MTDDWSDACDPVPARRELTEAQLSERRARALRRIGRMKNTSRPFRVWLVADSVPSFVDPDFDEQGA